MKTLTEVLLALVCCATALLLLVVLRRRSELARAVRALEESEGRYRGAAAANQDHFWLYRVLRRPDGTVDDFELLDVNAAVERSFARPRTSLVGQRMSALFTPEAMAPFVTRCKEVFQTGQTFEEEVPLDAVGLAQTWIRYQIVPTPDGLAVSARDVTLRRRYQDEILNALHEKELLLKEVHHRVKNNLQVISSLLSLQSRKLPEGAPRDVFRESQARVQSIALFHEKLYRSHDLGTVEAKEYVRDLVAGLFRTYGQDGRATYRVEGDALKLGVDIAVPCGLIVNELVSNSLKHAFPTDRRGAIEVEVRRESADEIQLLIRDDGVGLPPDMEERKGRSLGLQLVNTLVDQLGGRILVEAGPDLGAKFDIRFPRTHA